MTSRSTRQLITGPFQPTLEDALAARIGDARANSPAAPVIVLTGSTVLPLYLRRKLARSGSLWNVRFYTFAELAQTLGEPALRKAGRSRLPDWAEPLLVEGVIRSHPTDYFAPVSDLPGFVRVTAESIRDIKQAGMDSGDLPRSGQDKLGAFRSIFDGYQRALDDLGLYDAPDLRRSAVDAVPHAEFLRSATLIAYGFYDLNGLQRRLLLALAGQAASATALLPGNDAPAFAYARPFVSWLESNGFEHTQAAPHEPVLTRLFAPPAGEKRGLAPAKSRSRRDRDEDVPVPAFRQPANACPPDTRVLSVPGEPREVREIVRRVVELAESGVALDDIAVLLRSPDAYARPLREALGRRDIPCFVAGGAPLSDTRAARSFLMLADLLTGEFARADVMQFIHFAPIGFETFIGCTPNTSDWDLLSIHAGIVSGPAEWGRALDALERRADPNSVPLHELGPLKAFIAELLAARDALARAAGWRGTVAALLEAFRRFIAPADDDAHERVCTACREMTELAGIEKLGVDATPQAVRDALAERFTRDAMHSVKYQSGAVYVGDIERSRGLGFRAVILPGLVEKSFPAAARQDPILLDHERAGLARKTKDDVFLPQKSGRIAEERMLFALALGAGAESRTLTYSRLDVTSARERVPSHFVARLAEAVTGGRFDLGKPPGWFRRVLMFPDPANAHTPVDADEYDLNTVVRELKAATPENVLYLAQLSEQFGRGVQAETARWQAKRFTEFDGMVSAAPHSIAGDPMSPTRIEEYAACPFAYFLRRVLSIEPLEEPEQVERMNALERGSLIHDIFQNAYRAWRDSGGEVSAGDLTAALRSAADGAFKRRIGPALTWRVDCAEILADLARFAALDAADCAAAGARPALFEARFGMTSHGQNEDPASTDEPLALEIGGKTFQFKGRIDRIDEVGDDAARVIDYKTGKKSGKPDAFDGGRALQLPLYILAAQMLLAGRSVAEARYAFATGRGEFKTVGFSREALDARMDDLKLIIATAEACIEQGVFINTPDAARCRHCDFGDVCGANSDAIFERKKDDPAVADLLALGEIE
jgi:ATP-dependent helicase/nuclease subunit B